MLLAFDFLDVQHETAPKFPFLRPPNQISNFSRELCNQQLFSTMSIKSYSASLESVWHFNIQIWKQLATKINLESNTTPWLNIMFFLRRMLTHPNTTMTKTPDNPLLSLNDEYAVWHRRPSG